MGSDPILNWAREARTRPETVMRDLAVMTAPDRESLLVNIQTHYTTQSFRSYTPSVEQALHQLMANEFVDPPRPKFWPDFFQEKGRPNGFSVRYLALWDEANKQQDAFFSQPHMLAYVLQTVVRSNADAAPVSGAAALIRHDATLPSRTSRWPDIGNLNIWLYTCNYFEVLPAGIDMLQEGLEWLIKSGYQPPVAVETQDYPGGYHYYDAYLCGSGFKTNGHSVRIGMIPDRAPCTLRHELSHVIYAQLNEEMRAQVRVLYEQAMQADGDYSLIFNDEFYMHKYLHAGHPMQNDSEFFAGAMHAYTHHREELMANVHAPTTPKAVKVYALATLKLLDRVLRKSSVVP